MPLLTIEQCRVQCRVDGDYDDDILAALLASAEDAAAAYLNRAVYADAAELVAAQDALPDAAAAARAAYAAAQAAADAEDDADKADAIRQVAEAKLDAAKDAERRVLSGIVSNDSIVAAVRLTLGHLYANRESVSTGEAAQELPLGVVSLLRPYRKVCMP